MKNTYELTAPCHFGLEAVLKKEITELGYEVTETEDGRVSFMGDDEAVCLANIFLRSAERILIKLGSFEARSFEELYQGTKALPIEEWIPKDGHFWVAKAGSVNSALFSASDIQSVMKKAMVDRLSGKYGVTYFKENGNDYPIRVFIKKDRVSVGLDSTGASLHKRGYRLAQSKAPIAENLAAALIMLTPWHGDRILVDPFCGSGTIPIEAAMMAAGMAPGLNRSFTADNWERISAKLWADCREEARSRIRIPEHTDIQGYDLDPHMLTIARENAKRAGVEKLIHFQQRDVAELSHPKRYGFIITNPPYGERLNDEESLKELYTVIGERYGRLQDWSMFLITSYKDAQKYIGRKADKTRKLYNGMIKTEYLQYMGARPPKRKEDRSNG